MSSRKAIPNKPLLQSNVLLRILVRIFFKDYVVTAYLSDRLFLTTGHILLKISSKISCARATPKYPFKFRLNWLRLCFLATA